MPDQFASTDDRRTENNVMRHEYRVLSEEEKMLMQRLKDLGLNFYQVLDELPATREIALAKTKLEECVMWAVKHITR